MPTGENQPVMNGSLDPRATLIQRPPPHVFQQNIFGSPGFQEERAFAQEKDFWNKAGQSFSVLLPMMNGKASIDALASAITLLRVHFVCSAFYFMPGRHLRHCVYVLRSMLSERPD